MTAVRSLLAPFVVAAVFLTLDPLRLTMPAAGLDPSWGLAIERAALQGWQWGSDLIFTFGPYGYHYQRIFHPELVAEVLAVSALRGLLAGIGVALLLRGAHPIHAVLAAAAVLVALPVTGDTAYFLLPVLAVLVHFRAGAAAGLWYPLAVAAFCGLAALIKTTFAVQAIALLAVVDLDRMLTRRPPVLVATFLAVAFGAYLVAGQSVADLPSFLSLSLEVAAGFSHAMSLFGPLRAIELAAFLAASAVILTLVIALEHRSGRLRTRGGGLVLAALAMFWFITYKAGFTRHDLHTLVSWASLGIAASLYALSVEGRSDGRLRMLLLAVGLVTALLAPIRLAVAPGFGLGGVMAQTLIHNPGHTLAQAGALLSGPDAWMATMTARRRDALARIRDEHPLPAMAGTVDTVPSIQAAVIAAGLDYRPRPVIQEYSTYTDALIAANRAAFDGNRAPGALLLAPGSVDGRYPSLAEGPLWPEFLARYAPAETVGPVGHLDRRIDVLALRLRETPTTFETAPLQTLSLLLGREVAVPDHTTALFATVDLRLSPAGRALALLHQAPKVEITVELASGARHSHRLIPAIARAGFVLSPYVGDTAALARLFAGTPVAGDRVTALRLDVPDFAGWAFADGVTVTVTEIR